MSLTNHSSDVIAFNPEYRGIYGWRDVLSLIQSVNFLSVNAKSVTQMFTQKTLDPDPGNVGLSSKQRPLLQPICGHLGQRALGIERRGERNPQSM
jgi:hypothetical protein